MTYICLQANHAFGMPQEGRFIQAEDFTAHVAGALALRTAQTLEKPWFRLASRWIEFETATGTVMAGKAPKAGLYQLGRNAKLTA